jgi:hypothetical protein
VPKGVSAEKVNKIKLREEKILKERATVSYFLYL